MSEPTRAEIRSGLAPLPDARPVTPPGSPPATVTPDLASLVRAAQAHDLAGRSPHRDWKRVPDDQVARLIAGALRELTAERDAYREQRDHLTRVIMGKEGDDA